VYDACLVALDRIRTVRVAPSIAHQQVQSGRCGLVRDHGALLTSQAAADNVVDAQQPSNPLAVALRPAEFGHARPGRRGVRREWRGSQRLPCPRPPGARSLVPKSARCWQMNTSGMSSLHLLGETGGWPAQDLTLPLPIRLFTVEGVRSGTSVRATVVSASRAGKRPRSPEDGSSRRRPNAGSVKISVKPISEPSGS
jgi:hypothetical protein